jgi:environmental stress-induced protein Ves
MAVHKFEVSGLVAAPWKNGGGTTREIAGYPLGAGLDAFDWRVSIAHISRNGPFSAFPGVDRVITLLDGAGVHLRTTDGALDHRLNRPLAPFSFAGEAPVVGELLDGDCHDLNVMTRRDSCRAKVAVLRERATWTGTGPGLLMAVHGPWRAVSDDGSVHTLLAQHGLWWDQASTAWQLENLETASALLAVQIDFLPA